MTAHEFDLLAEKLTFAIELLQRGRVLDATRVVEQVRQALALEARKTEALDRGFTNGASGSKKP